MHLSTLQSDVASAWTGEAYSDGFNAACKALPHLPAAHAATHLVKAAAKVAAAIEPADHGGKIDMVALDTALADVLICACAVANKIPGDAELDFAVRSRLADIIGRQNASDHQTA